MDLKSLRNEECGDYIGGLSVTSTADDAMQIARGIASFLNQSPFRTGSIVII